MNCTFIETYYLHVLQRFEKENNSWFLFSLKKIELKEKHQKKLKIKKNSLYGEIKH